MRRQRKQISHNYLDSEGRSALSSENASDQFVNLDNFVDQKTNAKSYIQTLIKHIAREVNRHKLNYGQLKYVFRSVRQRCEVEVSTVKRRRLIELPTQEEIILFYSVIKNPVHRLIFETLHNSGLRVAELCSLEVKRIDFQTNLVFVSQGKGSKDRVTIIGNRLKEKLALYLENRSNRFLFESNRHTKYSTRRIEQLCQRYKVMAGVTKEMTPHTFRHLWNTSLAAAGLSEERRAILAGHEDQDTQKIYTHLSAGGFKEEVIVILDQR
jgi:integrase